MTVALIGAARGLLPTARRASCFHLAFASAEAGRRRGCMAASWRRTRQMPLRSSRAVATMLDPGIGVLDPVDCHLVDAQPEALGQTRSSLSKNQLSSSTIGSTARATSARMALKPHWASDTRPPRADRKMTL